MSRPMIQAAVTMNQLQQKLDTIGNNLANSQTTGYKSRQAEFSSLLAQQIRNVSQPQEDNRLTPEGVRVGSGARLGSINSNFSLGSMSETDRPLDVALQDENHLFQVQVTQNGVSDTAYTRDGAFYLQPLEDSENVMLVTKDGSPVLGETGPIVFEDRFDAIDIQTNGDIHIRRNDQTDLVGRLAIAEVNYPHLLETVGNNYFQLPELDELGYTLNEVIHEVNEGNVLKQATLETSNVDLSKQMTDLLTTQRAYQMNVRTITMGDQMRGLINQLR